MSEPVKQDERPPGPAPDKVAYQAILAQLDLLEQAVDWQEQRFRAVMEIGRALGRTFDLDTLLQIIMEKTTLLMNADRSTLFLVDRDKNELWSKVAQGSEVKEIRVPFGTGIVGWVVKTGGIVNEPDVYEDARFNPEVDKSTGYRTKSALCVPMFDQRAQIIGAVQVLNKRGGFPFDQDDERLLAALAAQAAVSIENSHLYQDLLARNLELTAAQAKLRHKMAEIDLLYDVERQISAASRLEDILDGLLEKATAVVGAEAGSVLLQRDDSGDLYFRSAQEPYADALKRMHLDRDRGVAGIVAKSGAPRLVNDVSRDPYHDPAIDHELGFVTRNIVAAPLRARGKVIGAIELLNKVGGESFLDEDLMLVTLIAGQASRAIAIGQAREAEERAERLSLLGQMVSGILHDLKTPMTVISGHAQLMALEDSHTERARHSEAIVRQFDHVNAMAREIMSFARGERSILVRKVYLHRFVPDVADMLRHDFEGQDIELVVEDEYRGAARFDENKIRRVITNIARNARDAMMNGGRFVWRVEEARDADGDWLRFTFVDTGGGIPPQMEGKLFDSFSTHGKVDGTGLGLAIVKKIVEEHGGRITYDSRAGDGTTFRVNLPF